MPDVNRRLSRVELRVLLATWGVLAASWLLYKAEDDLTGLRAAIRLRRVEELQAQAALHGKLVAVESELLATVQDREDADQAAVELTSQLTLADERVRELEARLTRLGGEDPAA